MYITGMSVRGDALHPLSEPTYEFPSAIHLLNSSLFDEVYKYGNEPSPASHQFLDL